VPGQLADPPPLLLQVGRLLGGIATSLLFSAFESWLVAEHFKRGYSESLLGEAPRFGPRGRRAIPWPLAVVPLSCCRVV
jgi:hypothetical protein